MTPEIQQTDVGRFRAVVAERLGLHLGQARQQVLQETLRERLRAGGSSVGAYLSRLEAGGAPEELGALASELTVTETFFFRNAEQIRAFSAACLEGAPPAREWRVLSAGCASGEEPYSLAITAAECLPESQLSRFSIRGVDVNPTMLAKARAARYTKWAVRETPAGVLTRWFQPDGRELVLADRIRSLVAFEERNLCADDPAFWRPNGFDVVFCRNVIMYLTAEKARAVVARIARSLTPGGLLFLGYAETLRGLSEAFELCHTHGTFYYQRLADSPAAHKSPTGEAGRPVAKVEAALEAGVPWVEAIQRASDRVAALSREAADSRDADSTSALALAADGARWDLGLVLDLLREERFEEALSLLGRLPPEARSDVEVLQLKAGLLIHAGRREEAERVARDLLAIEASSAVAHYLLALCREVAGARDSAVDHDRTAIYLDPTFAMPHLHLGILARRANQRDLARTELSQAMLLLERESSDRLLLLGGGFGRETLLLLCHSELAACGGRA
jgi:chemotaxis protein methyltransferase CheR